MLSFAFDDGEGLFDGVKVRAVGWQEQQPMAVLFAQILQHCFAVERRVISDNQAGCGEFFK